MQYRMILAASLALGTTAYAHPAKPQITKAPRALHNLAKRQQPDAAGSSVLDAPMTIAAGETFDGGNVVYDRGVSCTGQDEGGSSDAVFILESGASLSNVIIGPNQVEGVHCQGGCTVTNVWWEAVCEDAFSIKEQAEGDTTTINGGGATGAEDKVIQHNGAGTVVINDFTVSDFGKLYRSCGNCDEMPARHVVVSGGSATNGDMLVGINSNMGDTASISGVTLSGVEDECIDHEGVTDGGEPSKIGPCADVGSGGGGGAPPAETPSATTPAGTPTATTPGAADPTSDEPTEESSAVPDEGDDEEEEEETDDDEEESDEDEEEESGGDDEEEEDEEEQDEDEDKDEDDDDE